MNARMRFLAVGFWLLAVGLLFAQNSRFELFLRSTSNTAVTGASVYIVHMTTGDSLLLTEVSGKNGYYRRDDVTFGNYKIYVNGSLSTTQKFHPTDRIYLTLTGIDADGDYLIDSGSFEAGAIEIADFSAATKAYVATGGSFTSDSLRDMVGDSVAALSVDNVTTAIVSGKIVQKVFADTSALTATTGLEAGGRFIVKSLSSNNANGGGVFVKIPKGYSTSIISGVTFTNADGDTLIREAVLQKRPISPYWFGAKGDGSNDDTDAMQALENAAESLSLPIELGDGEFRMTAKWQVSSPNNYGFKVSGNGVERTKITFVGSGGIELPTGQQDNIVLRDFTIERSVAGIDTGLIIKTVTGGEYSNLLINNFSRSVFMFTSEDNFFRNVQGTNCDTGLTITANSNGNTFLNGAFQADSVGFYSNASHGNVFQSMDMSGHILFEAANLSSFSVIGGQFESITNSVIKLDNGSVVDGYSFRAQGNSDAVLAYMTGTCRLNLNNPFFTFSSGGGVNAFDSDSLIWMQSANCQAFLNGQKHTDNFYAYDAARSDFVPIGALLSSRKTGFGGETKYKIRQVTPLVGETGQSGLVYGQLISSSKTFTNYLTDGNDWRYDSNGKDSVHAVRQERMRMYWGAATGTTDADSVTTVSVWTDTSGVDALYPIAVTADGTSPDATTYDLEVQPLQKTPSTGEVKYLLKHKSNRAGGVSYRIEYLILAQIKTTGQW